MGLCNTANYNKQTTNIDAENIAVHFMSIDTLINYAMLCKTNEKFLDIENRLYNEYPEIRNRQSYFLHKGNLLNNELTLEKIGIKSGDKIIINFVDNEDNTINKKEKINSEYIEYIVVHFMSIDLVINYAMVCKTNEKFSIIEKRLYDQFPKMENQKCIFLYNRNIINNELNNDLTLEDIGIKNGDKILVINIQEYINGKYIVVHFISIDQLINCAIVCKKNEKFSIIKNRLCNQFPKIENQDFYFMHDGNIINEELGLEEIGIKNGDKIIINNIDVLDTTINNDTAFINEEYIAIIFNSVDMLINYAMVCKTNDKFSILENRLYNEYPEIKKRDCYFFHKGNIINRELTLENMGIKSGDKIIVNYKK